MDNTFLRTFYNKVYKKGEREHYSSLLFSGDKIPPARQEVLKEISWKGKRVLDAGCGTGELAYCIAQAGAREVIGVDYSEEAIAAAQRAYKQKNLVFFCDDLKKVSGKFDVIVSLGTLEHMDNPFLALQKLSGMLSKKGSLIITCPNWTNARGYMLLMLKYLFAAPITRADLHYFTPCDFEVWAKKLSMPLRWKTIEQEWGHGEKMLQDFSRRLPKIFHDMQMKVSGKNITQFIEWLRTHMLSFEKDTKYGGAVGLYHFKKQ